MIIGIDEAGRGPWAGPVVACSLCFLGKLDKDLLLVLNDSKKITKKKRDELYEILVEMSTGKRPKIAFGVGVVDNFIIDEINIRQANKEAMQRSLDELRRKITSPQPSPLRGEGVATKKINKKVKKIIVDGRDNYEFENNDIEVEYMIKGDQKVKEISAASIIAKVFRDKLMHTYATLYPELGFENHAGYGTKKHIECLGDKTKVTGIHRLSYKPVKAKLSSE